MTIDSIKKIAVVGAGTMGQGIAQLAAMAGFEALLYDLNGEMLTKAAAAIDNNLKKGIERGKVTEAEREAALARLSYTEVLQELQADVIIEAIIERLDVKQELFRALEEINSPDTLFATNTSSIPITQIAAGLQSPARLVGMHFFNPAHIMKLVEVISGAATEPETAAITYELALRFGKKPVMAKDAPGFIVNRVARHYYVESLKVVEEQVADFRATDRLLEATGFKMGPFRLMDLIGVDTNFSVTTSMYEAFHQDGKFRPSRVQQQKVDAGHHGRKSGQGFYQYDA